MTRRYVVVGTGAAGVAAAEKIRELDSSGQIILIGEEAAGYYSRPGLAYYLSGELPEKLLFPFAREDFRRLNLERIHGRVVALHPQDHLLTLEDGRQVAYDRLLLATGSSAHMPPTPGRELDGVVKLDTMEDARDIIRRSRRARAAVVAGGGITALELVEGLRARRVRTHYLLRRDRYWSSVLDATESRIVEHRLREEGVEIHFHTEVAQILGKRGRVEAVSTQDGGEIPCQIVAIAVGVRPNKSLAEGCGLDTDRGILVDETLATSVRDVFAAGDVAQVFDPFSGRAVLDTLWSAAVAQGRVAGQNMTGKSTAYRKGVAFNVTRLAGLTTTIIGSVGGGRDHDTQGIVRGDSEAWRQLPNAIAAEDRFEVNRLRVLVGEERLLGALVMGDQSLSQPLQHLVSHSVNVAAIRDRLLKPGAPLADILANFWIQWRRDHAPPHL